MIIYDILCGEILHIQCFIQYMRTKGAIIFVNFEKSMLEQSSIWWAKWQILKRECTNCIDIIEWLKNMCMYYACICNTLPKCVVLTCYMDVIMSHQAEHSSLGLLYTFIATNSCTRILPTSSKFVITTILIFALIFVHMIPAP